MKGNEKSEIRVLLDEKELEQLDKLKELLSCLSKAQTVRMLIRMKAKELYREGT